MDRIADESTRALSFTSAAIIVLTLLLDIRSVISVPFPLDLTFYAMVLSGILLPLMLILMAISLCMPPRRHILCTAGEVLLTLTFSVLFFQDSLTTAFMGTDTDSQIPSPRLLFLGASLLLCIGSGVLTIFIHREVTKSLCSPAASPPPRFVKKPFSSKLHSLALMNQRHRMVYLTAALFLCNGVIVLRSCLDFSHPPVMPLFSFFMSGIGAPVLLLWYSGRITTGRIRKACQISSILVLLSCIGIWFSRGYLVSVLVSHAFMNTDTGVLELQLFIVLTFLYTATLIIAVLCTVLIRPSRLRDESEL
ncbi:hypothetical protein B9G54_02850 [Alloscardovia macacae]|uniref:Uncharacterized protein n=1 Tax=Alloscardovia macacae TaxID=1160091 RepID=A0A1Y2T3G5_9BIFI|nr:hypothetical protein B9G54_02850 [Alloscardovia macacae]OTA30028.1 hypothetical protein B9T39_01300 [Alloscardovia macacae]